MLLLIPSRAAGRSIPYISSPTSHSFHRKDRTINCWSHIKIEDRLASIFFGAFVVIDYVSNLFHPVADFSLHIPVMPIERRLSPTIVSLCLKISSSYRTHLNL